MRTSSTLGGWRRTAGQGRVKIGPEPAKKPSRSPTARVGAGRLGGMTGRHHPRRPVQAAFALPVGFAGMLLIGVVAAAGHGRVTATMVLALTSGLVAAVALAAEPLAAPPLAVIGWFTVAGFSRPPYGDLHAPGTVTAGLVLAAVAAGAAGAGTLGRGLHETRARYRTLPGDDAVTLDAVSSGRNGAAPWLPATPAGRRRRSRRAGVSARRRLAGVLLAAVLLPLLTVVLAAARSHLNLADFVLVYLVAVCGHGGRRLLAGRARRRRRQPAAQLVLHPAAAHVHDRPAAQPAGAAAVRHRRGRRQQRRPPGRPAARCGGPGREEAAAAGAGADRARRRRHPAAVLDHLTRTLGGTRRAAGARRRPLGPRRRPAARRRGGRPVIPRRSQDLTLVVTRAAALGAPGLLAGLRRAGSRRAGPGAAAHPGRPGRGAGRRQPDADRAARRGQPRPAHPAGLDQGRGQQPAADRRRLDRADEAELLATIEENADRLDALIGNLLDMSRLHTGSLQPFLRPTAHRRGGADRGGRARRTGEPCASRCPTACRWCWPTPACSSGSWRTCSPTRCAIRPPRSRPRCRPRRATAPSASRGRRPRPGRAGQRDADLRAVPAGRRPHTGGVGLGLAVAKGFTEAMGGAHRRATRRAAG